MNTKILKFGGSSVANARNINKVIDIILQSQKGGENLVVVVSALGGVTDDLVMLATLVSKKEDKYKTLFDNICQRHNQVIKELIKPKDRENILQEISKKYDELEEIMENILLTKELSLYSLDAVMSFGEQLSAYIISEAIKNRGFRCKFIDARTLLQTDDNFGGANVDLESSYKLIANYFKNNPPLSILGGFIASTQDGRTTTLGRGGSDYTASLIGAALNASAIEIWTDVDGLMTADPRKVKDAVIIPEISYEEAEKMASLGAKVIHPKTMKPARLKNIPIYIKNTFNPKGAGTKISNENNKE
jgi:aspartokinase/homoserine dehydrogenase 1